MDRIRMGHTSVPNSFLILLTAATARLLRQKHQNSELSLRARLCPYPLTGWLFRPPGSGLPDLHDEHIANTPSLPRVFGILG
jgi:hypothetical protein